VSGGWPLLHKLLNYNNKSTGESQQKY